ncbi:MAG: hypothetical protein KAQ62_25520 [Cyclobacteriaceae bacterium]|nr:hypothetical protein [Cyclobacteriaceae bacterium]
MLDLNIFAGNSFFYPLRDNTYLCFKALEKRDREKFIEGFKKLSKASVYHRFFGFMKELSDKQLEDLLNTDKKDHVAWTAFDIKNDDMIGVGVGRFKRSTTNPHEAELALTVIDEYQNKGTGSILLAIMYFLASKLEIDIFTGFILSDNSKLIQRFRELGAIMTRTGNEFEMRLPVFKNFNKIPKSNYSSVIKPILQFLKENNFCA